MSRQSAVPYCTVKGFRKALQVLSAQDLPPIVDRAVLVDRGISPHAVYPVLGGLRYLGLLDEAGRVAKDSLAAFHGDDLAARRQIVEAAYSAILDDMSLPVTDREVLDRVLVSRHDCAVGVAPFCSTFLLWLLAESGLPVAMPVGHRRGRPPAHLAELSAAARTELARYVDLQRAATSGVAEAVARQSDADADAAEKLAPARSATLAR